MEKIEFSTIVDIFGRVKLDVFIAELKEGVIDEAHGIKAAPDISLEKITADDSDVIVLSGGYPGCVSLEKDERVLQLIRKIHKNVGFIGFIGFVQMCKQEPSPFAFLPNAPLISFLAPPVSP